MLLSSSSSRSVSATRSPRERPEAGSSSSMSLGSVARAMRDLELALLAVGDRAHEASRSGLEADDARQLARALAHLAVERLLARQAQVPAARAEHGEVEVVLDAEAEEEAGLLVRAPHAQPRAARGGDVRRCPGRGTRSCPTSAGMSPEMTLNSVVFPAPLGPRMARRSPGATSRSTSRTASRPPNRRPTPRRRRIGPACSVVTPSTAALPADDLHRRRPCRATAGSSSRSRGSCAPEPESSR